MLMKKKWYTPLVMFCASLLLIAGCGRRATLRKATRNNAMAQNATIAPTAPAPESVSPPTNSTEQVPTLQPLPLHVAPPPPTAPASPAATPSKHCKKKSRLRHRRVAKEDAAKTYNADNPNELDFDVENRTGRTLFVTCFSYQPRRPLERWHWIKSPIYEIHPYQKTTIDVDTIGEKLDRTSVFGYLGIFKNHEEADESVFELLPDKQKLDLDLLMNLKGKTVSLMIDQYGMKGEQFDFDFVDKHVQQEQTHPDLKFWVENNTGKTIFVCPFIYEKRAKGSWIGATEKKDDMTTWQYEKMSVLRLEPDKISEINIGVIATMRDKSYVRGELAVFDETQEHLAYSATYELLPKNCKVSLGPLSRVANKKIVLDVENYGIMQDYLNYVVKPVRHIDFQAIH